MFKSGQTVMIFTFGTEQDYQTFSDLNRILRQQGEDEWNLKAARLSNEVFAVYGR